MIVAVTPNPAWDVTYRVAAVRPGETHGVARVTERAGGKGVNTAGALTCMGVACVAVAPVGRDSARSFAADLDARGVAHRLLVVPGGTRRSVAVVDDAGEATVFNEVGTWSADPHALLASVVEGLGPGDVVTVSGSLPPDAGTDLVARVTRAAHDAGARVVLDVRGPVLLAALPERPDVVTPNRGEAAATLDRPEADPVGLARGLVDRGARAAVVSDGPAGLVLAAGDLVLRARGERVRGNPTGAGDALTAALAAALEGRGDLPSGMDGWVAALRDGVAWSAAAVLRPGAGALAPGDVARLQTAVAVEEVS